MDITTVTIPLAKRCHLLAIQYIAVDDGCCHNELVEQTCAYIMTYSEGSTEARNMVIRKKAKKLW